MAFTVEKLPQLQFPDITNRRDILQSAGINRNQLTPELKAQLKQLMGYQKSGDAMRFERGLEGFKRTAPLSIAQQGAVNEAIDPYAQAGLGALEQQQSLLGLRGGKAMRQAYNQNPAQKFAQQQAEKALIRNRAVTGGLGDEGMQMELAKLTSGLTNQNIQGQLAQLGQLSGRGQQGSRWGAGMQADIMGNQANTYNQLWQADQMRNQQRRAANNARNSGMVSTALNLGSMALPYMGGANVVPPSGGGVAPPPSYQYSWGG